VAPISYLVAKPKPNSKAPSVTGIGHLIAAMSQRLGLSQGLAYAHSKASELKQGRQAGNKKGGQSVAKIKRDDEGKLLLGAFLSALEAKPNPKAKDKAEY